MQAAMRILECHKEPKTLPHWISPTSGANKATLRQWNQGSRINNTSTAKTKSGNQSRNNFLEAPPGKPARQGGPYLSSLQTQRKVQPPPLPALLAPYREEDPAPDRKDDTARQASPSGLAPAPTHPGQRGRYDRGASPIGGPTPRPPRTTKKIRPGKQACQGWPLPWPTPDKEEDTAGMPPR